jgi:hypothetical protein
MKKVFFSKLAIVLLPAVILFSSCVSSTMIKSEPSGAKVYINGEPVGKTPYFYSDTKILGSITDVDLILDGYEPLYVSIERNEQVDVGAVVGGMFFGIPFLWTLKYNPSHTYELYPLQQIEESTPSQFAPQTETPQPVSPHVRRLRELKKLLDEKLITADDFEKQKRKILDEL